MGIQMTRACFVQWTMMRFEVNEEDSFGHIRKGSMVSLEAYSRQNYRVNNYIKLYVKNLAFHF